MVYLQQLYPFESNIHAFLAHKTELGFEIGSYLLTLRLSHVWEVQKIHFKSEQSSLSFFFLCSNVKTKTVRY